MQAFERLHFLCSATLLYGLKDAGTATEVAVYLRKTISFNLVSPFRFQHAKRHCVVDVIDYYWFSYLNLNGQKNFVNLMNPGSRPRHCQIIVKPLISD